MTARLVLLLLLGMLPLGARSWRIALAVPSGDDAFSALVETEARSHLVENERYDVGFELDRRQEQARYEAYEGWHAAYGQATVPSDRGMVVQVDDAPMPVELSSVVEDERLARLFGKGAFRWFCQAYGYDEILRVRTATLEGRRRCILSSYRLETDAETVLMDRLAFRDDASDLKAPVMLALTSSHRQGAFGACVLQETTPTLSVLADGNPVRRDGEVIVLPAGTHTLTLQAPGYAEAIREIQLDDGAVIEMPASLDRLPLGTLHAVSEDGVATWFVDGIEQGTGSSLSIPDASLPLVITASKEGFLNETRSVTEATDRITLSLRRDWLGDADLLARRQKDFYRSFVALVCSVGLVIAYPTWYNVYGDGNELSGSLYVACQGAAAMSAIGLAQSLFAYAGDVFDR